MDEEIFTFFMVLTFGVLVMAITHRIVKAILILFGIKEENGNDKT